MKILKRSAIALLAAVLLIGCFEDNDDNISLNVNNEIKDFIWRGLNYIYLYKDVQADLADNRFATNQEYSEYLNSFSSPEDLFNNLKVDQDRFSFLVNDYIALEQLLGGTSVSNGMEFDLYLKPGSQTDVFGIVKYVLPNTSAFSNGVQRGDVFDIINGSPLTVNNFNIVNTDNTYSITLGSYDDNGTPDLFEDDLIISGNETVTLTKEPYTENPVFKTEIFEVNGNNVGYLMYNGFTPGFNNQLNDAFGTFQSVNITDLVLDLRYNPGGSVNSAILLSSMITGQFNGEVFLTRQWNNDIQSILEADDPESLIDRFTNQLSDGSSVNSLNLSRVYILTTEDTASASELVINSLSPYINVVQIGDYTTGKYQASVTIYDSPNFLRNGANPSHLYAMQPLVFKSLNADGFTDYDDGLEPDVLIRENISNLGILGDQNEPLLAAALSYIEGSNRLPGFEFAPTNTPQKIGGSKQNSPVKNRMYMDTEDLPVLN